MLTKQPTLARSKYFSCRWRRAQRIAKSINRSALQIHAGKQRRRNALLALAQKPPRLLRTLYVPRKQDDSSGLQAPKQRSEPAGHFSPLEPNNQKLSRRLQESPCAFVAKSLSSTPPANSALPAASVGSNRLPATYPAR